MKIIKPKRLVKGDTIGIVAPASPTEEAAIAKSIECMETMGYKIKIGEHIKHSNGYLAGCDDTRAEDLNTMFRDKEVDGIICIRGGYGSARILDKIDYSMIKKNPKVFIGYSDISVLHTAIFNKTGVITFHGPMPASDMKEGLDEFSCFYFNKLLGGEDKKLEILNPCGYSVDTLVGGKASGRLVGGNLTMLTSTLGTPYEIDTEGKILFLEDIGEEPYRIDRMLIQLKLAGKLQAAEGIILCNWNDCEAKNKNASLSLLQVFCEILEPLKKPTLAGYCIGHCIPNITVPIGVKAVMDADNKEFWISESAVI